MLTPQHTKQIISIALLLFCTAVSAERRSSIEDMRNQDGHDAQGLYEIREEARNFIASWNKKHGSHFEASEPNLKTLVARCTVPLRAEWVATYYGMSGVNVFVICDRTVEHHSQRSWKVTVPVLDHNKRKQPLSQNKKIPKR